ncbi:MAG: endolytic transglycosylase MltG, partial [Dehalococcoidia bacterium]
MTASRALPAMVALGFAVMLGVGVWLLAGTPGTLVNEEPSPLGPTPLAQAETVFVVVEEGDSAHEIGQKLEDAGVIQSARLFRVLTSLMALGNELVAGEYEFEQGGTALTAVRRISQGVTASLVATIPEGLRREEIGQILEQRGVVTADEFLQALGETYTATFLGELPFGASLEGFLFPATYGFSREATGHEVVQQLLSAFDQRYRDQIQLA